MLWEKIGKIFTPQDHVFHDGCTDFAKSPQAVVFEDFVRIYFSAQMRCAQNKWISVPHFVDYTKDFSRILRHSSKPLLPPAPLGNFDEHGIFPFHVVRHEGKILAYTSGWSRRASVSVEMLTGLAISTDNSGEEFTRYGQGGPILAATPDESCLIGDAFVRHYNNQFYMWYIFGGDWKYYPNQSSPESTPERIYKIAQATSNDGIEWKRNGQWIIPDAFEDECQALPSVCKIGGRYHMVFCARKAYDFRDNKKNAYRLCYAYSDDLCHWVRADNDFQFINESDGWDSDMTCYPHIFQVDDVTYLLYNGNEFGKYGFGLAKLIKA